MGYLQSHIGGLRFQLFGDGHLGLPIFFQSRQLLIDFGFLLAKHGQAALQGRNLALYVMRTGDGFLPFLAINALRRSSAPQTTKVRRVAKCDSNRWP